LKHLVLLGAGHAHIHVLAALAAAPLPRCRVTLVSPYAELVYSGMVPGFVAGHYRLDECVIPVAALAAAAQAAFVPGAATAIDAAARRLTLAGGDSVSYDALSVDTGPVLDRDAIPGAAEHALFVRPMERFVQLWGSLLARAARRALDIVVVGRGAAGVELSMALQYRLGAAARVSVLTGGPPLLEGHGEPVRQRASRAMKRCGIAVLHDRCAAIDANHVRLGGGSSLPCDAPLIAVGGSAPSWLRRSGLALDPQGFVATVETLQSASHPEVFAAGDVASRADAPRPKSGVYAVRAGPPLALNLRRFVMGEPLRPYVPQPRSLNLLACGARRAIASYGDWSAEGRWVWWWKNAIDRAFVRRFNRAA
jgi:pyridine nucleotide-disulfide oxidoreductase family protein